MKDANKKKIFRQFLSSQNSPSSSPGSHSSKNIYRWYGYSPEYILYTLNHKRTFESIEKPYKYEINLRMKKDNSVEKYYYRTVTVLFQLINFQFYENLAFSNTFFYIVVHWKAKYNFCGVKLKIVKKL